MSKGAPQKFGTGPVFFTAISTILGAILFLRFGYAVGMMGFWGVMLIILVGHMVTIPTALALSEIATNQKVRGGGEYFIISRSFGMNIGSTIGFSLYLSQTISVAFYVIAFTEAFEPLFNYVQERYDFTLPRQVISLPAMALLSWMILKRGAGMGVMTLYLIAGILFIALALFFAGKSDYTPETSILGSMQKIDFQNFFIVFAIVFPAFTGMTAGVGLSGDLKKPGRSIPLGTTTATVLGMIIYFFLAWKLYTSAPPEELIGDQLVMKQIAIFGPLIIPLGLAASTISSAIGSVMVAPRTMQALARDKAFPGRGLNKWLSRGKSETNEPYNASILTIVIAFVFVALGNVNAVAEIISMFFMITYGSLCLISFLFHFGADPSYRPLFRSRWYISLLGFAMCFWLMFKINAPYAIVAIFLLILVYLLISSYHKDRKGVENIFSNSILQINRGLQVYLQKKGKTSKTRKWRPSVVCISNDTFERENALRLLNWISYRHGFGTYIHLIEGYFSSITKEESVEVLDRLLSMSGDKHSQVYIDTLISPSYTSAIAQVIQLPGISGMENNMILFEFDKANPDNLGQIIENFSLSKAAGYDVCILGSSPRTVQYKNGIHIWIRNIDHFNANLMILLGFIINGSPPWRKSEIRIFEISLDKSIQETREKLLNLIHEGRLPITENNIEIIRADDQSSIKPLINERSKDAGLTMIGFHSDQMKHNGNELFMDFEEVGDVLFVNARELREIS
jgi:amino acid transporter